ncbi:HNH endonuclease [Mycobacterium phage BoostSeason]|nr:HNH endonuclease [Mycobacterium phage BoostSeason]
MSRELLALHDRIKWQRADGRCECQGDCGRSHRFGGVHYRCPNKHGNSAVHGGDKVVTLSVRPLDGDERNLDERNLIAMCQACMKRHRAKCKAEAEREAERRAAEAQHESLFELT